MDGTTHSVLHNLRPIPLSLLFPLLIRNWKEENCIFSFHPLFQKQREKMERRRLFHSLFHFFLGNWREE